MFDAMTDRRLDEPPAVEIPPGMTARQVAAAGGREMLRPVLGADDDWCDAPELGFLARVFNQDTFNLAEVQRGLKTTAKKTVTFANYQEIKLRHFHRTLENWLARP